MQVRALLRPLSGLDTATVGRIRIALLIALAIVNGVLVVRTVLGETLLATDWGVIQRAATLAGDPKLYTPRGTITFVWSPLAAYPLQLLAPISVWVWRVVLIGAALAMPTWRLRVLVLVSWPFWTDWTSGNLVTIIFLTAVYAWRGSRVGTVAFFALALLIPRPLLLPMAAWILWKRPEWRWPMAMMFFGNAVLVWWTGLGPEWIATLLHAGPDLMAFSFNRGPTKFFGYTWFLIGVPLGLWLFLRGRVGWAGLAISPYIWGFYFFWLLPEVNRPRERDGVGGTARALRQPKPPRPVRHPRASTS